MAIDKPKTMKEKIISLVIGNQLTTSVLLPTKHATPPSKSVLKSELPNTVPKAMLLLMKIAWIAIAISGVLPPNEYRVDDAKSWSMLNSIAISRILSFYYLRDRMANPLKMYNIAIN